MVMRWKTNAIGWWVLNVEVHNKKCFCEVCISNGKSAIQNTLAYIKEFLQEETRSVY